MRIALGAGSAILVAWNRVSPWALSGESVESPAERALAATTRMA